MSKPVAFTFTAPNVTDVCALQTTTGAGNLIINGNLANTTGPNLYVPNVGTNYFPATSSNSVSFGTFSRTVSLKSAADLSAIHFTITGTYRNDVHSETITGPTAGATVYTNTFFDTVTAVSVDAAVGTNVSVGSGTTGQSWWNKFNYNATVCAMSIQVIVAGTINYSFQVTLDSQEQGKESTNVFTPVTALTGATTNILGSITVPVNYFNIIVNSSTVNSGTLTATFVQQGIT